MNKTQQIASILVRFSLAGGFLSAVSSRLGLWGKKSSGWSNFLDYTAQVNSFLPKSIIPPVAITSTILETIFGTMLIIGFKTKLVAGASSVLLLLFALAMAYSFGVKEPLDYSVFAAAAGAFLLSTIPGYYWSIDALIHKL